jgi:glycine cleavage system aminomethyltransferase T
LLDRKEKGPSLLLTKLILDDPSMVVMGYEPILYEGKVAGFVTSAGYDYNLGKGIVFAVLSPEAVNNGSQFDIEYFGQHYTAKKLDNSAVITK